MADLKLPMLPDRTPVKLTIMIAPELHRGLQEYAAVYNDRYNADEALPQLIPHMLDAFLAGDREFARALAAMKCRETRDA